MANRKKAEDAIVSIMNRIEGKSTVNSDMYKTLFKNMSDKEFDAWMGRLEREEEYLSFVRPNGADYMPDNNVLIKLLKEIGVDCLQHLTLTDPVTGEVYTTVEKYLILDLLVRRQSQHLIKKISVTDGDNVVDQLTGQVTGISKSRSVTMPEILALESKGMKKTILELIKVRGGDDVASTAMKDALRTGGNYDVGKMLDLDSIPTATESFRAFLLAAHIDNTLGKHQ